jgi:hypothetical protein
MCMGNSSGVLKYYKTELTALPNVHINCYKKMVNGYRHFRLRVVVFAFVKHRNREQLARQAER